METYVSWIDDEIGQISVGIGLTGLDRVVLV